MLDEWTPRGEVRVKVEAHFGKSNRKVWPSDSRELKFKRLMRLLKDFRLEQYKQQWESSHVVHVPQCEKRISA
jgi:hypothetical protein